jgi:predicted enzyme related to lactoylglutathione lyase
MTTQGKFHWNELTTGNVRSARSFYSALIGWTTEDMPMADGTVYTLLKTADAGAPPAGGIFKAPKGWNAPDMWMAYVEVDDVDAAAAKVKKLRGSIMRPPFDVPGVGRICFVTDPGGACLGLITPAAMAAPPAKTRKTQAAKPRKSGPAKPRKRAG